jgi:ADP-ribosylglycohydrolase
LIGDAVGVPYEFKSPAKITSVEFRGHGSHDQPMGTWSDDGSLMLALLDSLLTNGFDPEGFATRARAWYERGMYTPDGDGHFDIGTTTRLALEAVRAGSPAEEAGLTSEEACGNGSLMRILPLPLVERDIPDEVLVDHAQRLSRVTHGHARPQVACALYVLVARRLLQGSPRADALSSASTRLRLLYESRPVDAQFLAALDHLEGWPERGGRGRVWDSFWSAWDAFAGAGSFQETIERAVAYGNDTDTTAAIAGGLAGIRFGLDRIPPDWLARMRGREIVAPLVDGLIATIGRRTSTMSPLRVDWFDPFYIPLVMHAGGQLGMTLLPGKRSTGQAGHHWRDLVADADRLRDVHHCDVMVLLVEDRELARAGVSSLPLALAARGIHVLRYPIPDGGAPADRRSFRRLLDDVIRRLLSGATVVVACRGGLGRTGLTVACLVRDLADIGADDAIEGARLFRDGAVETKAQEAFVAAWDWPRRRPVARALAERRRRKAAEEAAWFATLSAADVAFERLFVGLRKLLRPERLEGAYLIRPEFARPAPIVCFLVDPADPKRLVRLVRTRARRWVASKDLEIVVGHVEGTYPVLYRVLPAPPDRLGA